MSCPTGYFSYPRKSAPERFSIQTGLICNLFGVQSPLCKWVDELLPTLPIADALKDVGKQMAKKIRSKISGKINWQALQADALNPNFLKQILDWKKQIEDVNQIINDIIDIIQGGEVSTLEFCLAGKPEFPAEINFGDVFLAFTGVYPKTLVDKLSAIVAYQKYFEYCECRQFDTFGEPEIVENELVPIPEYGDVVGTNLCNPKFSDFLRIIVNPANQEAKTIATKEGWENLIAQGSWNNTRPFLDYGVSFESFTFDYCTTEGIPFEIVDIPLSDESIDLQDNGALNGCCRITFRRFRREVRHPSYDIAYVWTNPDTGIAETYYLYGDFTSFRCLSGNSGTYSANFSIPYRGENLCYKAPVGDPPNLDIEPIEPIFNPCDDPVAENFQGLCPQCPPPTEPCQVISANVRVIRDCRVHIEPRSLYWN